MRSILQDIVSFQVRLRGRITGRDVDMIRAVLEQERRYRALTQKWYRIVTS